MFATTEQFEVRQAEVGVDKRVTVPSLMVYCQESAYRNVRDVGFPVEVLYEQNMAWVLSRFRLEMNAFPAANEMVQVETWPSGSDKYYFYRDFRLYSADHQLIGSATSTWIIIDLGTRGLRSVPDFLAGFTEAQGKNHLPRASQKLGKLAQTKPSLALPVAWHHLDINQHVNNTFYFSWLLDALPFDWLLSHRPVLMDVMFRAECGIGDTVNIAHEDTAPLEKCHLIYNQDGKELAKAFTRWEGK